MNKRTQLTELTAHIVAAHVSNNSVTVEDMPQLIHQVHAALSKVGLPPAPQEQRKTGRVSVRASVKPDFLVCMECGRKQKTLKRHLQAAHGTTPSQYRKDYGLPDSYSMTAANYSDKRKELAKTARLGHQPGPPPRRKLSIKV